eukprot:GEMP01077589.1.p1 GENE.GEMP01077589.1~~GEMP01077589.1.p1  ORF type:complete len:216 (+),score=46.86 GEMP01077589.1:44-649(+)
MYLTAFRRPVLWRATVFGSRSHRAYGAEQSSTLKPDDEKLSDLHAQITEAQAKLTELEEKLEFQKQDLANSKRRHIQALGDAEKYGITKFAKEVLDISDNLERARLSLKIDEVDDTAADAEALRTTHDGVVNTQTILKEIFAKFTIEEFNPIGQKFDPNKCDAMFRMPVPGAEPNSVVHVLETGFTIHDRILRPARVGTAQ